MITAKPPIREYTSVLPNRHEMLRYAPLILAALHRANVHIPVKVHRILAVYEDAEHDVAALTWGDLCATVREALDIGNRDARSWEARAGGRLIPYAFGVPAGHPVAALAVADETLAVLVVRAELWTNNQTGGLST